MPKEFTAIKERNLNKGQNMKTATRNASITFWKKYGISPNKAHKLELKGKWNPDKYKKMKASGVLKKPNSILLIGDTQRIDELKNVTGLFPVDEEIFDEGNIGAEFIVRSTGDRDLLLDSATNLGLATSVSKHSMQPTGMSSGKFKARGNGLGSGWHGDTKGHSRAGRKGWRNRK